MFSLLWVSNSVAAPAAWLVPTRYVCWFCNDKHKDLALNTLRFRQSWENNSSLRRHSFKAKKKSYKKDILNKRTHGTTKES